jgi:REP element-mobilizing transposase RayT
MWFELFDPDAPVAVTRRFLPHWFQPGATYFVTFRTIDSLPRSALDRWLDERARWLRAREIDPDAPVWQAQLRQLAPAVRAEYHRTFTAAFHDHLDAGYGECPLRRPEAAGVVAAAFRHFDGERYRLSDFVVMPNHAHVLFGLIGEAELGDVCYSWKKFTAGRINRLLGRSGHFWQGESFDHIVRSPEQFEYARDYIAANPVKAGLKAGEFVHYRATFGPESGG